MRYLLVLLALSITGLSNGQSLVYGLYTDANAPYNGYSILATIDAGTGTILEKDTIYGYDAVALGSSSFDQLSGNYIYVAAGNQSFDLLSRNVYTNTTVSSPPSTMTANALQFDMASGQTYALGYDMSTGTTFLSIDVTTGTATVVSSLAQVDAVVLGASCFDPMDGIFYFIGISTDFQSKLFGVDAQSGQLVMDITMDLGPNEYLNELEYDIEGDVFYALHRTGSGIMHFAQIDPVSGQIFDLLDITGNVNYFTPDASVYEQENDQFIMLTVSPNTILTIDADEGEVLSQAPISYSIIELEVDNVDFANAQFVSVAEYERESLDLFPNPSDGRLFISSPTQYLENTPYLIRDNTGAIVARGSLNPESSADVQELKNGSYIISVQGESGVYAAPFLIQR
ncbi:MAG: T9SS type A sorting domain-containing protein [Flavobacteriales bacterium]|nr:T9SS type A sorting domain-containing protein [Flavobacteriales bacterium]